MRVLVAALAAFFMSATLAIADDATSVTIPVGAIASEAVNYIGLALAAAVAWGLRRLPSAVYALAMTLRVEQLLDKAISYALNAVKGAAKDKVLTVDVGSRVLAEALAYAIHHGGSFAKQFAGDPVTLAEKIWARLDLGSDAEKPDFRAIAAQVALTLPKGG